MMNKKKLIAGGISIVAAGLLIFVGTKIAMSSKNDNNQTLQIEKKSVTTITTQAITSTNESTTTRTETTTTTPTTTNVPKVSEETTTFTTTLPKEIIPEVTTTFPKEIIPEVTTTTTTSATTTTVTTTTEPITTTEVNPENIEDITTLSYEDVRAFVISNFDNYPEDYELSVRDGVYYLNEYVVVFTDMKNIGELKETSIGMGIVVSSWARTGYVIVMEPVTG